MKILNIYKIGQSGYRINNVVDEFTYESRYKPQGWVVEGEQEQKEPEKIDEQVIVEKEATKKRKATPKKFNDNLIKEE